MIENILGLIALCLLAFAGALVVTLLVRKSLQALLKEVVRLPAGTTFYTRLLVIGLFFIAFSSAFNVAFDLKPEATFMEYVWKVADGLSSMLGMMCLFLTGYLILITILVAVLRRHHGK